MLPTLANDRIDNYCPPHLTVDVLTRLETSCVMVDTIYSMSFTTATLLYRESITLAELYIQQKDWRVVRDEVVRDNLLQMRTENASKRICTEGVSRLRQLTPDQLDIVRDGSRQDQVYVLWLAVCKRYRFIYEFASEVVREKYLRLDLQLSYDDYDVFFSAKAEWHPEVERVAPATRKKQRQFVFKMLREADLLSSDGLIQPAMLTPRIMEAIACDDPAHLSIYPASYPDLKEWAK